MNKSTKSDLLRNIGCSVTASIVVAICAHPAAAQTTNLVGACSGVSLPRSVVTGIMAPVIGGIVTPVQGRVNGILGALAPLPLVPPLSIDAAGLLTGAAAGAPITLQVLNTNGTVVGPADRCDTQADSFVLRTPAGIAIGGNRITGLGSTGLEAQAGEANSIALGNGALTDASSTGAVAIGTGASVAANATNSVALGAGSVAARGALTGYAAPGSIGLQSSAGEFSVGAPGALRQITNVAAGTAPSDAATVGQLLGLSDQMAVLSDGAVRYDTATHDRATLTGIAGTTLANVARGTISATSTEAVNGAQLFETNASVTNLATTIGNGAIGPVRYADAASPSTPNGGTATDDLTLVAAGGGSAGLHNVRAGVVAGGSTDAVNGGQLFAVDARIGALAGRAVQYDDDARTRVTMGGAGAPAVTIANVAAGVAPGDAVNVAQLNGVALQVATLGDNAVTYSDGTKTIIALGGTGGTTITNVRAGSLATGSTDAVNGSQLAATNVNVANNTTAIANLTTRIDNGGAGPVRYADAATATTPNGGTPSNDLTLVGATAAPVGLHNVAAGRIEAGSTDAVTGDQVYNLAITAVNAVSYDSDAAGRRTNRVTLAGGSAGNVAIANVAAGTLSATSTEAVNGAQLNATNQDVASVQTTATAALALGQNAVQYDAGRSSVTFNAGGAPATLANVGPGVRATDAANVGQLNTGLASTLAQANGYTDARLSALDFNLRQVRRNADAGTAGALAAAGLPQAYEAGKGMIALGGGVYGDQSAVAFGASKAFGDGHTVAKLGGTYDTRGRVGASGGIGYQF